MNARLKAGIVYTVAAVLVAASWIGNAAVYRHNQLPEAGFLRHYIEATDGGGSFELLYIANRSDPRRIVGVTIDGLPWIRFQVTSGGNEMRYQRVQELMAIIDPQQGQPGQQEEAEAVEEEEPLVIREVRVYYNEGASELKSVGEIRLYREAARAHADSGEDVESDGVANAGGNTGADTGEDIDKGTGTDTGAIADAEAAERPFDFQSGGSSSDGSGFGSVTINRPVTLTKIDSAWLPVLGDAFEWQASSGTETLAIPAELDAHEALSLKYRFRLDGHPAHDMDVFQLMLRMSFQERNDRMWDYSVFASHKPRMTEAQVRAYVQGKRRERA